MYQIDMNRINYILLFFCLLITSTAFSQVESDTVSTDTLSVSSESSLIFLNDTQLVIDVDTVNYSDLDSATMVVILDRKKVEADQQYNQGVELLANQKAKESLTHFDEAIRLMPQFALAYANRGVAYVQIKRINSALINFRKAIELDPAHAEIAYFNRGLLLLDDGKDDEAFKDFSEAIKANKTFAAAYYERGILFFQRTQYDQAQEDFKSVVNYEPKHAYAWNDLGSAKRQLNDLKGAEIAYSKAIAIDKTLAFAYNNRGSVRVKLNKIKSRY